MHCAAIWALLAAAPRLARAGTECWTFDGVVCVFASDVEPLSCYDSEATCERWHPTPADGCWTYGGSGGSCAFAIGGHRSECSVSETDCRQAHLLCWTPSDGVCTQGGSPDPTNCFPSRATCEGAGTGGGGGGCWMNDGYGCQRTTGLGSSQCYLTEEECSQAGSIGGGSGGGGGSDECWVRAGGVCMYEYGSGAECFASQGDCEAESEEHGCWVFHSGACVYEGLGLGMPCAATSEADCERQHGLGRRLDGFLAVL